MERKARSEGHALKSIYRRLAQDEAQVQAIQAIQAIYAIYAIQVTHAILTKAKAMHYMIYYGIHYTIYDVIYTIYCDAIYDVTDITKKHY